MDQTLQQLIEHLFKLEVEKARNQQEIQRLQQENETLKKQKADAGG
jgi:hypothetical protein